MVIADTGSNDNTIDYLNSFPNVKILNFKWQDNFSLARNACLDHVFTLWVLFLDSDEVITLDQAERLKGLLLQTSDNTYGYLLKIASYHSEKTVLSYVDSRQNNSFDRNQPGASLNHRLVCFRSHPHVRYRGRVHESVNKSITELGKKVSSTEIIIHNYGSNDAFISVQHREALYSRLLEMDVREFPKEPKYQYEMAIRCFESGNFDLSMKYLTRAIELKPNYFEAYFYRGKVQMALNQFKNAIEDLMIASNDMQIKSLANYELGRLFEQSGFYSNALQYYDSITQEFPNQTELCWSLIRVLEKLKMYRQQITVFEKLESLDKHNRNLYYYRSILYARLGDWSKSLLDVNRALVIDQSHLPSLFQRALVLSNLGDIKKALQQLEIVLKIDPSHRNALDLREHLARQGVCENSVNS